MKKVLYAAVAAVALVPASAMASKTVSGSANGLSWTASSTIVGQTSTGNVPAGSPNYLALNGAGYSGSVGMLMTYSSGARFVCSGTLLTSGKILTAAHCVSDGFRNGGPGGIANGLVRTQVLFQNDASNLADARIYDFGPGVTAIDVASYNIHFAYTGEVIDQNDIAVLTLAEAAPVWAQKYDIYTGGDLTGDQFNVNGFGTRSNTGGVDGTTGPGAGAGTGRRRQGDNVYDYRLGDAAFGGFFTDPNYAFGEKFFGTAAVDFSYVSDFDNGTATNSQSCRVAAAVIGSSAAAAANGFCTNGVGVQEVGIAGGDSGGAAFIGGKIASVNSYSLSFGTAFGDFKPGLQSSWGEMNGFVPTFIHADFIAGVPEPSTWAMMILGFAIVGGGMRRRTALQARFA